MREGRTSAAGARMMVALLLALPLAGCNEYLDRREGITATGGDAVRANIATHVANPWQPGANDANLVLRADRLVEIIERNKEPPPAPPPPRAPQSSTAK
jgi:ABC-type oligopeptide transport system substrate-binding subunit